MKKLLAFLSCVFLSVFSLFPINLSARAFIPLDRILDYEITVNPRDDATLDMEYYFKWEVLDSKTEGPLSWVKIGVANRFVDEITPLTDNIAKIKYYSDSGAYIRIDFKKHYVKGDVIEFRFSFHQKRIFTVDKKTNQITFGFIPGWFDEIKVDNLTVKWNKTGVFYDESKFEDDNYYIWQAPLNYGETFPVNLSYENGYFPNINLKEDYSDSSESVWLALLPFFAFLGLFGGIFIIICVLNYIRSDGYYRYRGFSGRYRGFWYMPFHRGVNRSGEKLSTPTNFTNGGGSGHSGGGCACACACACAGGGRAGCSRKDFYHVSYEDIEKIIDEDKENTKKKD